MFLSRGVVGVWQGAEAESCGLRQWVETDFARGVDDGTGRGICIAGFQLGRKVETAQADRGVTPAFATGYAVKQY